MLASIAGMPVCKQKCATTVQSTQISQLRFNDTFSTNRLYHAFKNNSEVI